MVGSDKKPPRFQNPMETLPANASLCPLCWQPRVFVLMVVVFAEAPSWGERGRTGLHTHQGCGGGRTRALSPGLQWPEVFTLRGFPAPEKTIFPKKEPCSSSQPLPTTQLPLLPPCFPLWPVSALPTDCWSAPRQEWGDGGDGNTASGLFARFEVPMQSGAQENKGNSM